MRSCLDVGRVLARMSSSSDDEAWTPAAWLGQYDVSTDAMNKLVLDYLLAEGYKDAAEKLMEETGMVDEDQVQVKSRLDERIAIKGAIMDGDIEEAINLLNNLLPELLDYNTSLHFHLLLQELIELIRAGKMEKALTFAQQSLAEKGEKDDTHLHELQTALALLAFDKPDSSPYAYLLNDEQRHRVANEVNCAVLRSLHLPGTPSIESLIKMVLWSQEQLDRKRVTYPRMTDIAEATIHEPKKHVRYAPPNKIEDSN